MKSYIFAALCVSTLFFINACDNNSTKSKLVGTWVFEKYMTGESIDEVADPKERFELTFTEKGMVYSVVITPDKTDTVQVASYQLSKDERSFVLTNKATAKVDIINIKELSTAVLRTQEQTRESVSVFKRK